LINEPPTTTGPTVAGPSPQQDPGGHTRTAFSIKLRATRHQIFKAFEAIANLADKSDEGKLTIQIEATNAAGYDPTWLRNAVEEPLDEADVERGDRATGGKTFYRFSRVFLVNLIAVN
jgi:hypothetical protein